MVQILFTILVVLNYPRTVAGLTAYAKAVVLKMTGNPHFPTPTTAKPA